MDPALYYRVYEEEINKPIIIRYNKSVEFYGLYYSATDHVRGN